MSRRTPLIVLGAVLLAIGCLTALTGAALAAFFGSGDRLSTGSHPVSTATRALVSEVSELDGVGAVTKGEDQVEIDATPRAAGRGVFVGIARAADVERYLAGADVDVVTDLEVTPFGLTTRRQAGTAVPAAPAAQTFWVARAEAASGTAHLSWPVQDGDYRIVIMNADASPVVDADARFALVLPSLHGAGVIALVAGLGITLLGGFVLTLGLRTPRPAGPSSAAGGTQPFVPAADTPRATAPR
jgi:hypothetical protein